ncbi:transposase [Streptomyces sioyaensis]|uniref:IS256 family transposase n=1 Tax=Streptomyces sioyaensis TaxID=67364 RepID=UPI0037D80655
MADSTASSGTDEHVHTIVEDRLVEELLSRACPRSLQLAGVDGLEKVATRVLESALQGELTCHLGYEKHDPVGRKGGNSRNGTRPKTVLTDIGPLTVAVPRDKRGTFTPQIIGKHQRQLTGVTRMVLSLAPKRKTHEEICAELARVYGAAVNDRTVATIARHVLENLAEWHERPLDSAYPVLFIDVINGRDSKRPVELALALTSEGRGHLVGLWSGSASGSPERWHRILAELSARGLRDVRMLFCDSLTGLSQAAATVWPAATTHTDLVDFLRRSLACVARPDRVKVTKNLTRIRTAPTARAATGHFSRFARTWGQQYPELLQMWQPLPAGSPSCAPFGSDAVKATGSTLVLPAPPLGRPPSLTLATGAGEEVLTGHDPRTSRQLTTSVVALAAGTILAATGSILTGDGRPYIAASAADGTHFVNHRAPGEPPTTGRLGAHLVNSSIAHAAETIGRAVVITIDDGPDPTWTPRILQVLRDNGAHATFCMIGPHAAAHPSVVKKVLADGNRLCDHTVSHNAAMDHLSNASQKREILDAARMIEKATGGAAPMYYRAPGGAYTPYSRQIAAAAGMRPLGWNVDSKDYKSLGVDTIIRTVKSELHRGPTLLFHDGGGNRSQTVQALQRLLPWLKSQGYTFSFPVRVSDTR